MASAQNADAALRCLDAADQALGTAGNRKDDQYWREWIDLALARMKTYYYAGDVGRLRQVIETALEPVDSFGTEEQRSTLDIKRLACAFREERFQVSEQTVAQAREQWTRSQDNVDPYRRSQAEFLLGFALLWHGELDEAEHHLKACREIAERSRDRYRRAVASTYLAVLDRMREHMEMTQTIALRAAEEASDARLPGYVAAAKANLAWVALRQGDAAVAEEEARRALRLWKAPSAYPFEWLARGPLLRISLQKGDLAGAIEQAEALLFSLQQRIPFATAEKAGQATKSWRRGEQDNARILLADMLTLTPKGFA